MRMATAVERNSFLNKNYTKRKKKEREKSLNFVVYCVVVHGPTPHTCLLSRKVFYITFYNDSYRFSILMNISIWKELLCEVGRPDHSKHLKATGIINGGWKITKNLLMKMLSFFFIVIDGF